LDQTRGVDWFEQSGKIIIIIMGIDKGRNTLPSREVMGSQKDVVQSFPIIL
jgi:hypothetical protein